jgi:hypothetical protein
VKPVVGHYLERGTAYASSLGASSGLNLPEMAALSPLGTYLWPSDLGVRLVDVPADGLVVPWSNFEQHRQVYYGLLNAGFNGVTLIEGERLYQEGRICQVGQDGIDRCAPK